MKLRERRVYQSGSMTYLIIAVFVGMLVTTIAQAESDYEGAGINYIPDSIHKGFLKYNTVTRSSEDKPVTRHTWLSPYNFDSSLSGRIYSLRISAYAVWPARSGDGPGTSPSASGCRPASWPITRATGSRCWWAVSTGPRSVGARSACPGCRSRSSPVWLTFWRCSGVSVPTWFM